MYINNMKLSEKDFRIGAKIVENELLEEVSERTLSEAIIYCILSTTEIYWKQIEVYNELKKNNLLQPNNILKKPNQISDIVSRARFPNQKIDRILNFAEWSQNTDILLRIVQDSNNGKEREVILRKVLAEECPGISFKAASLVLNKCGYENVVPVDIWIIRFLRSIGYMEIPEPNYKTNGGVLAESKYLAAEREIVRIAEEYNVTPNLLQATIWGKSSNWIDTVYQRTLLDYICQQNLNVNIGFVELVVEKDIDTV